jgi:hypothetical protein
MRPRTPVIPKLIKNTDGFSPELCEALNTYNEPAVMKHLKRRHLRTKNRNGQTLLISILKSIHDYAQKDGYTVPIEHRSMIGLLLKKASADTLFIGDNNTCTPLYYAMRCKEQSGPLMTTFTPCLSRLSPKQCALLFDRAKVAVHPPILHVTRIPSPLAGAAPAGSMPVPMEKRQPKKAKPILPPANPLASPRMGPEIGDIPSIDDLPSLDASAEDLARPRAAESTERKIVAPEKTNTISV